MLLINLAHYKLKDWFARRRLVAILEAQGVELFVLPTTQQQGKCRMMRLLR